MGSELKYVDAREQEENDMYDDKGENENTRGFS